MSDSLRAALEAAYENSLRGRFGSVGSVVAQVSEASDLGDRTWAHVLTTQLWLADPARGQKPALFDPKIFAGDDVETKSIASRLCALGMRCALLCFDRNEALRWLDVQRHFADGVTESGRLWAQTSEAWGALMHDDSGPADEIAETLSRDAAKAQEVSLVLEAAALKAMASSIGGDNDTALQLARRASRMARTEAIPQQEYLANIVLARTRRLIGKPHLATFILSAVRRFAPASWHGWIAWELSLSPGVGGPSVADAQHQPILAMYETAGQGDVRGHHEAFSSAEGHAAWLPDSVRDTRALYELMTPAVEPSPRLQPWTAGETHEPPRGLQGLIANESGAIANVYAHPEGIARRFLGCGEPLLPPDTHRFAHEAGHVRNDTAIATLLLAREGLGGDELWRLVYGFPYIHDKHRTIRNTLIHRMRKRLEPHAQLVQHDDVWTIQLQAPISVPDPRCLLPREHTLLNLMARSGSLTAAHVAERMGIPLRTAQQTLKELASDGACNAERAGREIRYRLEDTTFCEPTDC